MLINRNPDAHCVILIQTIWFIDYQSLLDVSFQLYQIVFPSFLILILNLLINPTVIFQYFKPFLTSQEFCNKYINVIVHKHLVVIFVRVVILDILLIDVLALIFNNFTNVLVFKQMVNGDFIETCFFKNTQSTFLNVFIFNHQKLTKYRKTPTVKIWNSLSV